ncbi:MAG: energy transducer TonB [Bacteroidales bacterium]|nr:energy transducer TonB [Bacteroidales bacterium]
MITKRLLIATVMLLVGFFAVAQNDSVDTNDQTMVFHPFTVDPEFPGGIDSLYAYLCRNVSYPAEARDSNITGKVCVTFVVERDGSISNPKILRDIGGGCGAAVVEAVKNMPRWKPGRQGREPVPVQFNLPVNFSLDEDDDPETKDMTREEKCLYRMTHRKQ